MNSFRTRTLTRRRVLAGLPLFGLSLARWAAADTTETSRAAPKPTRPTPAPAPDFRLFTDLEPSPEYPYPYPGNLVRGGRFDGDYGPLYKQFSYGGCFYRTDSIWAYPKNGFTGSNTLEILNLPAGVTSLTAPSITVDDPRVPETTVFKLQAASDTATGHVTVTVRATSGAIVHTFDREFWVVDALPPCV